MRAKPTMGGSFGFAAISRCLVKPVTKRAPRAKEWNDLMMTFQQKVPEAGPNDWWAPAKLVFDSEWF